MKTKFGVSSAAPINTKLKNGYTMFDWVMRQSGFPDFCIRTLCGDGKIASDEIGFLRANDCKIGLAVRDLTEAAVSATDGTPDAIRAAEAAKALGVPQNAGIALFAEIEPDWSVNHNWLISFARTLSEIGYVPGFIANTDSSKNFNFDRQCSHFVQATKDAGCYSAVFAATEPKCDGTPEAWTPFCPSALEPDDMALWVCGEIAFDSLTVKKVYKKGSDPLEFMW